MHANAVKKRGENTKGEAKRNEGWMKPTRCVAMAHFCKQKNNKSRKNNNNNINDNGHSVLTNDMEVESHDEVDVFQITTKERCSKMEK